MDFSENRKKIKIINQMPSSEIVGKAVDLTQKGTNFFGLCPFHNDNTMGSFVVSDNKNRWTCFTCGKKGSNLDFVMEFFNVGIGEAIDKASELLGLENVPLSEIKPKTPKPSKKIASDDILDLCYNALSSVNEGNENQPTLSLNDYLTLCERGISDFERYFTFPKPNSREISSVIEKIKKAGLTSDILEFVPGFFWDKNKKRWSFFYKKGLGIKLKNINGQTIGINIRTEHGPSKYVWFSSGFAEKENSDYTKGTGMNAVYDFVKGENVETGGKINLYLTEGHFKACSIAKMDKKSIAVAIPGVTHQRILGETIEQIKKIFEIRKIYIAFDSDMHLNSSVMKQTEKLSVAASEFAETFILQWSCESGKGIDDFIKSFDSVNDAMKEFWTVKHEDFIRISVPLSYEINLSPEKHKEWKEISSSFVLESQEDILKRNEELYKLLTSRENNKTSSL